MRLSRTMLALPVVATLFAVASLPAQAQITRYVGTLGGASQVPVNASTATGAVTINILSATSLSVSLTFSGLTGGNASAAHIHQGAPGLSGAVIIPFTGFPSVTSGTYSNTFTDSGNGVITGVISDLQSQKLPYYVNIHNATFPGGEIRANLVAVPEAGAGLLLTLGASGALGMVAMRRRAR